jgi:hypothetical protein
MKGILKKKKEGWFVVYDQRTFQDPSAEDGILPLHPLDVKMIDEDNKVFDHIETRIKTYPNVEFEINMYDGKYHISNAWNGYAKLIDHIGDANKMVEISDEEIEEQSWGYREVTKDMEMPPNEDWSNGAKWYREQLKNK